MRLTTVFLMAAFMHVSAASVAQRITLKEKKASLVSVLRKIRQQSGYDILFDKTIVSQSKPITVSLNGVSVNEALATTLIDLPVSYTVNGTTITIKKKTIIDQIIDYFATIDVHGQVVDESGKPLVSATVNIKGSSRRPVITDNEGRFTVPDVNEDVMLVVSYVGYELKEIRAGKDLGKITLIPSAAKLEEVNVVSTGYQTIPKERATGAFTQIDNKTISRSVGVNILDRLDGVTSGLIFNKNLDKFANNSTISIRGRSTLFANAEPLIVLDGFPYDGTIDQINSADIESVTVLKDAAAASIWGTRASNGVIVLTSKKGMKNQKLIINLSSTLTISNKPNLYYIPQISSSDYIDLEQNLFRQGYYDGTISQGYAPISSAVEIMNQRRNGLMTAADSAAQINALKGHDVRSDLAKYSYRPEVHQQYQLSLRGGGESNSYYISGGYDKNLESAVTDRYDRLTFNGNNVYSLLTGKLEISSDFNFSSSNTYSKYAGYIPYSPYDRFTDNQGNPLSTVNNLRVAYADTAGNGKLLDWLYRPKDELNSNQRNTVTQYKLKFGVNYNILSGLNASASYQYLNENGNNQADNGSQDYYTRDLINTFSSISGNTVTQGIPSGDILNQSLTDLHTKIFRAQLNYSKVLSKDHEINAITGYEINDGKTHINSQTLYGFQPETQVNGNNTINPVISYPYYYYPNLSQQFSVAPILNNLINFTRSYYGNISYVYQNKYILSGSARRDESNLFGVKTNQKGVPLWSTGLAWNISKEKFFDINWLSALKVRATYGYNGNVDKTLSGLLTTQNNGFTNRFGSIYSSIFNPPNPSLKWETVKTWNLGLDFSIKDSRLSGSIDAYIKNGQDLIGNSPISMESGISQFKGNNANLQTKGTDLILNSRNLINEFKWSSSLLFNYNTDKVTDYKAKQSSNLNIVSGNYNDPLEGYPYYGIFSFRSAGLDATGAPQGYFNGVVSKDYSSILNQLDPSALKFHGSASPKYFGSLINTFNYKGFELSLNIVYKFDYYFRRTGVFDGGNYLFQQSSYDKRWQKPGDELTTYIPALVYPSDGPRSNFFQYSENLVERGDHIRFQDARLSYQLTRKTLQHSPFKMVSIFTYAQNLGILWRKNRYNIDPDYGTSTVPQPFNCSLGINITL